ncbi:MAG: 16S rRNA (cytosine(1402)-N(4))-methyltransferase RsmH [Alphaproteobacteria bacterium]
MSHIPVLIEKILPFLDRFPSGIVVDATFGAGGYTRQILEKHPNLSVIGFDQDNTVLPFVKKIQAEFPTRFSFIQDNFENISEQLKDEKNIVAVVMDLGVSSMQIDQEARGFSYQKNGKLDMRMDVNQKLTAFEIVNNWDRKDLRQLFWKYGEENFSPLISANICHAREKKTIETTFELRKIIESSAHSMKAVMRCFQAIRIAVNDELGSLEKGLENATKVLQKNGVLAVVSFHSLEDRIAKKFMISKGKTVATSRYMPADLSDKNYEILTKKPILPSENEIENNPRSRSAKLRILKKR